MHNFLCLFYFLLQIKNQCLTSFFNFYFLRSYFFFFSTFHLTNNDPILMKTFFSTFFVVFVEENLTMCTFYLFKVEDQQGFHSWWFQMQSLTGKKFLCTAASSLCMDLVWGSPFKKKKLNDEFN
jgi:hypothetical protein